MCVPYIWCQLREMMLSPFSKIVFHKQSYSSLHSGQSLAWDHFHCIIGNPCSITANLCGVIADPCGVIAYLCRIIIDPCGDWLSFSPQCDDAIIARLTKHLETLIKHNEALLKHCEPLVKHNESLMKYCETSWNTWTLAVRCDNIATSSADVVDDLMLSWLLIVPGV